MKTLKELTHIVTKNKLKSIEVIGADPSHTSRVSEFYRGLLNKDITSDEEAMHQFYSDPSYSDKKNYNKLKNKLKKHLINTLFFIDVKQKIYNNRQRAYYECHKDWAAANILFGKNAQSTAIELSLQVLKRAQKYEFTYLTVNVIRMLRLHYGVKIGDFRKYNYYKKLYKTYLSIFFAEMEAEELYSDLVIFYVNKKSRQKLIHASAVEAFDQIKDYLEIYDTHNLHLYGGLIRLMVHTSVNDYESALVVCDDIIDVFSNKKYKANTPLQIAYYQQLVCYTQLRQYEKGKIAAENCINLIDSGSFNWFKYLEQYLMFTFHTRQYEEVCSTFNQAVKHKRFKFLPENSKEVWKIFRAYLFYLRSINVMSDSVESMGLPNFRLAKFMNELSIFSKDKEGLNIPILIIQLLLLIQQKKYNIIFNKTESIEKYSLRYLKKRETLRSYCFIKMLLIIPATSFHKVATIRKSEPFLKKLKATEYDIGNQSYNVEIIPYEILWKYVLTTF